MIELNIEFMEFEGDTLDCYGIKIDDRNYNVFGYTINIIHMYFGRDDGDSFPEYKPY